MDVPGLNARTSAFGGSFSAICGKNALRRHHLGPRAQDVHGGGDFARRQRIQRMRRRWRRRGRGFAAAGFAAAGVAAAGVAAAGPRRGRRGFFDRGLSGLGSGQNGSEREPKAGGGKRQSLKVASASIEPAPSRSQSSELRDGRCAIASSPVTPARYARHARETREPEELRENSHTWISGSSVDRDSRCRCSRSARRRLAAATNSSRPSAPVTSRKRRAWSTSRSTRG